MVERSVLSKLQSTVHMYLCECQFDSISQVSEGSELRDHSWLRTARLVGGFQH